MIQKQEEKLLIELYRRYYQGEREPITELALGESLNLSYKQLHEASSFWIQKGCVKTFSKRGGQSAYIITDMGLIEADQLVVRREANTQSYYWWSYCFFNCNGLSF